MGERREKKAYEEEKGELRTKWRGKPRFSAKKKESRISRWERGELPVDLEGSVIKD